MKRKTNFRVLALGLMLALIALTQIGGLAAITSAQASASQPVSALQGGAFFEEDPFGPTPTPTPVVSNSAGSQGGGGGG